MCKGISTGFTLEFPPSDFYNPTGWFHGSSAKQSVLKEDISWPFFLEQLVELQQGPGEVMKGMGI